MALIGLRLSGKSTLGRAVARQLDRPFVDLDDAVLRRLGATSVTEAFHAHGEAAWRAAESAELARIFSSSPEIVLALGGGAPAAPGAADLLRDAQSREALVIVLLDPGEEALVRRLAASRGDRPPLHAGASTGDTRADAAREVRELLASRMPLYRSLADETVDTRDCEAACARRVTSAFLGRNRPGSAARSA